jgi:hypothetical protein
MGNSNWDLTNDLTEWLDWEDEGEWLTTIELKFWAMQYCLFKE